MVVVCDSGTCGGGGSVWLEVMVEEGLGKGVVGEMCCALSLCGV